MFLLRPSVAFRFLRNALVFSVAVAPFVHAQEKPFCIEFLDAETGRGVPLVEAETMGNQLFLSDSAGRVAFAEPGQMGVPIFFSMRSHGYEFHTDGYGSTGAKFTPKPGETAVLKIKRLNIAERMCRLTGLGIYRDSVLLGKSVPLAEPLSCGGVAGQDSVHVAEYRGRLFWLWGDTMRLSYPLGNFRTSCAWSDLPAKGGLPPSQGVNYHYCTGPDGFAKEMCPLERKEGVVWLEGLTVVKNDAGQERLVASYSRRSGLGKAFEQGMAIYNDERDIFERASTIPVESENAWRRLLQDHPVKVRDGDAEYLYFGETGLNLRVPATLKAVLDPGAYEAWTCAGVDGKPRRKEGLLDYAWRRDAGPTNSEQEKEWLKAGLIKPEECRLVPEDVETHARILLHRGSVYWNEHRQRWILIAVQRGGKSSFLGEVWYAESAAPTGPWKRAVKIVTHDRYSFYNPVQHPFFDEDGGRRIYFEGTYSFTFSGREARTPLYDYNQILYRLDLDDPRLKAAQE